MDELVDVGRDDSPDAEVWPIRHVDRLEPWIGRYEPCGAVLPMAKPHRKEISGKFGDDDAAIFFLSAYWCHF